MEMGDWGWGEAISFIFVGDSAIYFIFVEAFLHYTEEKSDLRQTELVSHHPLFS